MSAPALPADHSLEVEQMREQQAREAQTAADAKAEKQKQELAQLRSDATTAGRGSVNQYFSDQGLVPEDYAGGIDSEINRILSSIPRDDPNPGSYFSGAGASIYGNQQDAYRNKEGRALDKIFAPNFETSRIPSTLDDATIGAIGAEQYQSADDIIKNMLTRGVITPTGATAAETSLGKQTPGVTARLNEIGQGILGRGQSSLRDVANRGRSAAGTANLGSSFDPYSYGSEADRVFNEFLTNLPGSIRAAAPGNLYSTAGLGAIAGAGSGAQNTAFDPAALAGVINEPPVPPRTSSTSLF